MQIEPSGAATAEANNDVDIDIAAADSSCDLPAPISIRREVFEFGALPVATWLPRLDSPNALPGLLAALLGLASEADRPGGRRMVPLVAVADVLGTSLDHVQIIADVLDSVADEGDADLFENSAATTTTTAAAAAAAGPESTPTTGTSAAISSGGGNIMTPAVARSGPGAAGISAVDAHALALFLWVQLHLRAARRPETMDVWPPGPGERAPAGALEAAPGAPLSPRRVAVMTSESVFASNKQNGVGAAAAPSGQQQHHHHQHHHHHHHHQSHSTVHVSHARTSPLARRELADHVAATRAARAGYLEHVRRSASVLLALVADAPGAAAAADAADDTAGADAMTGTADGDGDTDKAAAAAESSSPPPPSSAPPVPTHSAPAPPPPATLTAAEFDRLGLLLRPAAAGKWYRRRRRRRFAARKEMKSGAAAAAALATTAANSGGETPMDEDPSPSSNATVAAAVEDLDQQQQRLRQRLARRRRRQNRPAPTLSSVAPGFADASSSSSPPSLSSAPTGPLAAWLRLAIGDDLSPSEALAWPVSSSSSASTSRAPGLRGRGASEAAATNANASLSPSLLNGGGGGNSPHTPTNAGAAAAVAALEAAAAAPPAGVLVSGFSQGEGGADAKAAAASAPTGPTPAAAPAAAPLSLPTAAAAAAADFSSSSDDDDYEDDCEECDNDEAEAFDVDRAAAASLPPKGIQRRRRRNLDPPCPPFAPSVVPGAVDVVGVCRSTVARGEASFPSGTLRVADCHDATIYALAPLDRAAVVACSDCTIVLGAVGRALRLERCERVHVVVAAARVAVDSCHDCLLSLGTNGRPLVLGSSRGLKFGPHCAGYARLRAHMALAGVTPEPNRWDAPCGVGREPVLAPPLPSPPPSPSSPSTAAAAFASSPFASSAASAAASNAAGAAPASLLEPEKFAPLVIPFVGGSGPLCGGAALPDGSRLAADAGALLGLAPATAAAAAANAAAASSRHAAAATGGNIENDNPTMTTSTTSSPTPSTPSSPTAVAAASARLAAASPFALPRRYAVARERKVSAIADLRSAVRRAALNERATAELQASIQAHFKEWLASSGHMRHVYDLARLEREEAGRSGGGGGA